MIDSSNAIVVSAIVASLIFVVLERRKNKQGIGGQKKRRKRRDPIEPDRQPVEYGSVDKLYSYAKRVVWWSVKIICGGAVILGTFYSVFSAIELFFLLTGRIVPDFEQPPVSVVSGMLAVSLVLMIVGYKAPKWLDIDRLL